MYLARSDRDPESRPPTRWIVGGALLAVAAIATGIVAGMPAPYVIESPGPVFDVLGQAPAGEEEVPMISIPVEETFPTEGALRLLTVYATQPQRSPSWIDVIAATFDPRKAVLPVEAVYPPGLTLDENAEQSRIDMENSQLSAIAAALHALGYDLDVEFSVAQVQEGGAAVGILEPGDVIRSLGGAEPTTLEELRAAVAANGTSRPMHLAVERGDEELELEVTPQLSRVGTDADATPVLGILVQSQYVLPFTVTIQLDNVGGPSAGLMFALGIYDKLTPGALTDGEDIAGTGTIDAMGRVGAIGGIRQKMWGALDAGADWFLAPVGNCAEVAGSVPDGLRAFAVGTLEDAIRVVGAIGSGGDLDALPSCEAVLAG